MKAILLVLILLSLFGLTYANTPAQAAPEAPPTVKPCQMVNTAIFSSGVVIEVALCQPEGGLPYLLDSFGFMKDVE